MSLQINAASGSVSSTATVTIQQRVACLTFKLVKTGTTSASTAQTALAAIQIEIKRKNSNGERTIFPVGGLLQSMEMNTHILSAINTTNDGTDTTVKGSIILVDEKTGGSLAFSENEKLEVNISAIPAGCVVTMNSIAFPGEAQFKYGRDYVGTLAGVKTTLNVQDARFIGVPRGNFTQVEVEYADGRTEIYLADELSDLMDNHKPNAYVDNGLVTPGGKLIYMCDVDKAVRAYVTTSAADKVEVFKLSK